MEFKVLLSLICLCAMAGTFQASYTPFDSGAKLNWHEAKSFCEARGLVLPKLSGLLAGLIASKFPYLVQESFWGDGRCSWKNEFGYELDLITSKYQRKIGLSYSNLSLECYGLSTAKPCIITPTIEDLLPACFSPGTCPSDSFEYGGVCVGFQLAQGYSIYYKCSYQSMKSTDILERINRGVHLPLLGGKNSTKYWISLGSYSCTSAEKPYQIDYSENGDCFSTIYDAYYQTYIFNGTDCRKALAKYIICQSIPTTTTGQTSLSTTSKMQSEVASSQAVNLSSLQPPPTLPSSKSREPFTVSELEQKQSPSASSLISSHSESTLKSTASPKPESETSLIMAATAICLFLLLAVITMAIFFQIRFTNNQIKSRLDQVTVKSSQDMNPKYHTPEENAPEKVL